MAVLENTARVAARKATPRRRTASKWGSYVGFLPALLVVLFVYIFAMAWTIWISFTKSKMLPVNEFVGFAQYSRLFGDERWQISVVNLGIFCSLFIGASLVLGLLMAIALDQRVRFENSLRTIYLYPQGMSFIVTGLIWQWILNPQMGLQQFFHDLGLTWVTIDWLTRSDKAIYVVALAGVWQASGLVMAIMLAGLRGVDEDLAKAAKVDGISPFRFYVHIVLPLLKPMFATAVVLLAVGGVKVYDLVVALTNGGPGISSEVPAKYVMEFLFRRANIGLASAAASVMLITVIAVVVPYVYLEHFRKQKGRTPV
ncbi:sugar ABC transporter permease [Rhizobium sp. 2MFCol3.1]|uniref:carbohydrate ABC transporter permease n=1 Tax=Rhizobium sp. 2MFCol3.1 TaxID=1246459 RepID=UPI000686B6F8|nr:sugar ABC transporter permease [Rhizobium sp. 2MFCol3.1]